MFDALYSAIEAKFRSGLKNIPVSAGYPETKKIAQLPTLFFEMIDFEPATDPMDGEMNLDTTWEARVIFAQNHKKAHLNARAVAAQVALLVHNENFVPNGMPCRVIQAMDDGLEKLVSGHYVWVTEWRQVVRVGLNDFEIDSFYPELSGFKDSPAWTPEPSTAPAAASDPDVEIEHGGET